MKPTCRELVMLKGKKPNTTGICPDCEGILKTYGVMGICYSAGCRKYLEWVLIKIHYEKPKYIKGDSSDINRRVYPRPSAQKKPRKPGSYNRTINTTLGYNAG